MTRTSTSIVLCLSIAFTGICSLPNASTIAEPEVTLCHGGKLRGRQTTVDGKKIYQFLGVRYAKAPVGELRFKRPGRLDSWSDTVLAQRSGSMCMQLDLATVSGKEDCLFMDINVPGGIHPRAKKPVMVFIHGGSYVAGDGAGYIGAPIAAHGDVIVVSINYRLDILGFLFNGKGTGNFGLWDQRAALVWIKENIELFGGDPDRITIFGESAGGSSVAAQMMGQYNDGLFKRAIVQSGGIYAVWSWYSSRKTLDKINEGLKQFANCTAEQNLYECLRTLPGEQLIEISRSYGLLDNPWHPQPDEDFFPMNVIDESYDLSKRFDLMAGFNGQEGTINILDVYTPFLAQRNETFINGTSFASTNEYLKHLCESFVTDQAPELCANYVIQAYDLRDVDPIDRLIHLSRAMGDADIATDVYHLLLSHSTGCSRNTYGYHFTKILDVPVEKRPWVIPDWLKESAEHGAELPFIFGVNQYTDDLINPTNSSNSISPFTRSFLLHIYGADSAFDDSYETLSGKIMTMWTKFAKTGTLHAHVDYRDPNQPKKTSQTPYWYRFDDKRQQMIQLDDRITYGRLEIADRLVDLKENIFSSARRKAFDLV